jgi:hypothetical protein
LLTSASFCFTSTGPGYSQSLIHSYQVAVPVVALDARSRATSLLSNAAGLLTVDRLSCRHSVLRSGVSKGIKLNKVQLKQWEGLIVLRGCLGYLVGCNENEARGEESDFIVWRDTSVFCSGLSYTSSAVTLYSSQGKCDWPGRTIDLRSSRGASKRSAGPTWFAQFPESDCEQLVMFCGAQW